MENLLLNYFSLQEIILLRSDSFFPFLEVLNQLNIGPRFFSKQVFIELSSMFKHIFILKESDPLMLQAGDGLFSFSLISFSKEICCVSIPLLNLSLPESLPCLDLFHLQDLIKVHPVSSPLVSLLSSQHLGFN
jgi:hypothetical protein